MKRFVSINTFIDKLILFIFSEIVYLFSLVNEHSSTDQTSNTNLNNNSKPVSLPPKTRRRSHKTELHNRQKRRSQFDVSIYFYLLCFFRVS